MIRGSKHQAGELLRPVSFPAERQGPLTKDFEVFRGD